MDTESVFIPRKQLLKEMPISESSERRRRSSSADWPPHVLIGKKVYYRRSQVEAWVERHEARSQQSADDKTFEEVLQHARKVADLASSLDPQQQAVIQDLFAISAGTAS